MHDAQLLQHAELLEGDVPRDVLQVPSMMHQKERRFLYGLARQLYTGDGYIVDAGIFLGGSTVSLGRGVMDNPQFEAIRQRKKKPIQSFELGIINPGMIAFFARHGITEHGEVGESFEPILRANIQPVEDVVSLHMGDISKVGWNKGDIEILFLDVIKSREIQDHIYPTFFPHLLPGRSILIQQDYFIDGLPFLKVAQERFDDQFEFIGGIASTAVFRARPTFSPDAFRGPPEVGLDPEQQLALIGRAEERAIEPARKFMVALARARLVGELRGAEDGLNTLTEVAKQYPACIGEGAAPRLRSAFNNTRTIITAGRH